MGKGERNERKCYNTSQGKKLPAWQPVDWGGFKISAKPKSWWRRWILQLLPYWYGAKPKFELFFERLSAPTQPKGLDQLEEFEWFIRFLPGDVTGHVIKVPQIKLGETYKAEAGDRLLGFTGDTLLGIWTEKDKGTYHTLYSFKVIALEDLFVGILLTVIAALLAFVLSRIN